MKQKVKRITITVLVTLLSGLVIQPLSVSSSLIASDIKNLKAQETWINVFLPTYATVTLKQGKGNRDGKLTDINAQSQQIQLSKSGRNLLIKISDVEQIILEKEVIFIERQNIVIRGDNSAKGKPETWTESIQHFKLKNAQKGHAAIKLTSLSKDKIEAIQEVEKEPYTDYVVREIRFSSPEKIAVTVVPY